MIKAQFLTAPSLHNGENFQLAYTYMQKKNRPTVMFLPGFRSDMNGFKSLFLKKFCEDNDLSYVSLDYFGHGQSEGSFEDGTLSQWLHDVVTVIAHCRLENMILVGSSMGGWLMLQIALRCKNGNNTNVNNPPYISTNLPANIPTKIMGLVGVAIAPDFTLHVAKNLTVEQQQQLLSDGFFVFPTPLNPDGWMIRQTLLDDSAAYYMLHAPIPLDLPLRLIHGCADEDVSFQSSLKIMQLVHGGNVHVHLIKDGDHRLSRPSDLDLLAQKVTEFLPAA